MCVQASWADASPLSTRQWRMQYSMDFTLFKISGIMVMVVCGGCCVLGLLAQFSLFPTISFGEYCDGGLEEHFCNTSENFWLHREHMQLLMCFIFTSCVSVSCNSVNSNELHGVKKFWRPGGAVVWFSFAQS